ncbi:MAG: hypothetical protein AAGG48_14630 [Planctomycetota bacterium]
MRVIALHGDFASGAILRRDTGIDEWEYPDWKRGFDSMEGNWVAVAYSSGGSRVGHISLSAPFFHGSRMFGFAEPRCAVLYESPLIGIRAVGGSFPVLWIENDRGARTKNRWRAREMQSTLEAWQANGRRVDVLQGRGRHVQTTWGWPPLRHGWDKKLNPMILKWIEEVTSESPSTSTA